jgi:hypothetical protein
LTYRNSLLVAAATGFGVSVAAMPVHAANRQIQPGFPTDISQTKMVMPLKRLMPSSHKTDPADTGATVNTNNLDAGARFANGTGGKN